MDVNECGIVIVALAGKKKTLTPNHHIEVGVGLMIGTYM